MTARSPPVTTGCAQPILNCRASTSRTTRSCCGLAHACGEKVDETATDEDDANETRRGVTVWTPEFVQVSLEWLALRAALARRRAIWLTRLFDSSVVWREPGDSCARLIVIEKGEVVVERGSGRKRNATDSTGLPPSSGCTS